jgi:hypothetical protein
MVSNLPGRLSSLKQAIVMIIPEAKAPAERRAAELPTRLVEDESNLASRTKRSSEPVVMAVG